MNKKKGNGLFIGITIGIVILCFIGLWYISSVQQKETTKGLPTEADIKNIKVEEVKDFNLENQPMIGDKNAPVTVVEFGDFKCPACKMWKQTVYPNLYKDYIETGKVKFYFINFQFIGPDSYLAGVAGEAIYKQDEKTFWEFYNMMYDKQGAESTIWANQDFLLNLVKENFKNIDYKKFEQDLTTKKYLSDVMQDKKIAEKYGVFATPSIFINGKILESSNYDDLRINIEKELQK